MSAAAGEAEAAVVVGARRASWEPPERRRSVVGGREGGGCSSLCSLWGWSVGLEVCVGGGGGGGGVLRGNRGRRSGIPARGRLSLAGSLLSGLVHVGPHTPGT